LYYINIVDFCIVVHNVLSKFAARETIKFDQNIVMAHPTSASFLIIWSMIPENSAVQIMPKMCCHLT